MSNLTKESYRDFTAAFIRALRGEKSQSEINRKLQSDYNRISKWEKGDKRVPIADFIEYLEICAPKMGKKLFETFMSTLDVSKFFNLVINTNNKHEEKRVLTDLKVSYPTLKKWQSGESVPYLDQFFHLLNLKNRLHTFVKKISHELKIELPQEVLNFNQQTSTIIHYRYPWAIMLAHYIMVLTARKRVYKIGTFSEILGIDLAQENEVLEELEKKGAIEFKNDTICSVDEVKLEFDFPQMDHDDYLNNLNVNKYYMELSLLLLNDLIENKKSLPLDTTPKISTGLFSLTLTDKELQYFNERVNTLFNEIAEMTKDGKGRSGQTARIFQLQIIDY